MTSGPYRFDRFALDPDNRQLLRDGEPVDISGRYLDALALMVSEHRRLVSKDRFMKEVWRGVPVTDEALTQAIAALRRTLGDDASAPKFIETVPKHGYRFIAPLAPAPIDPAAAKTVGLVADLKAAGLGGALAGAIGGLAYGVIAASLPGSAPGGLSTLLVILCLTFLVAVTGALGAGLGIGLVRRLSGDGPFAFMLGGGLGGAATGLIAKLLALDAFMLLIGQAPRAMTGAPEGALLGGAVGLALWASRRFGNAIPAIAVGALAGLLIVAAGGRLWGGSLALLGEQFRDGRLRFDKLGQALGERGFEATSQYLTGMLEAALFTFCIVAISMRMCRVR